jgi:hypothetical protein
LVAVVVVILQFRMAGAEGPVVERLSVAGEEVQHLVKALPVVHTMMTPKLAHGELAAVVAQMKLGKKPLQNLQVAEVETDSVSQLPARH